MRITTRPPAGAEGSGCTVETETFVARADRLKGLAPRAVCRAPQPAVICVVMGIDVCKFLKELEAVFIHNGRGPAGR